MASFMEDWGNFGDIWSSLKRNVFGFLVSNLNAKLLEYFLNLPESAEVHGFMDDLRLRNLLVNTEAVNADLDAASISVALKYGHVEKMNLNLYLAHSQLHVLIDRLVLIFGPLSYRKKNRPQFSHRNFAAANTNRPKHINNIDINDGDKNNYANKNNYTNKNTIKNHDKNNLNSLNNINLNDINLNNIDLNNINLNNVNLNNVNLNNVNLKNIDLNNFTINNNFNLQNTPNSNNPDIDIPPRNNDTRVNSPPKKIPPKSQKTDPPTSWQSLMRQITTITRKEPQTNETFQSFLEWLFRYVPNIRIRLENVFIRYEDESVQSAEALALGIVLRRLLIQPENRPFWLFNWPKKNCPSTSEHNKKQSQYHISLQKNSHKDNQYVTKNSDQNLQKQQSPQKSDNQNSQQNCQNFQEPVQNAQTNAESVQTNGENSQKNGENSQKNCENSQKNGENSQRNSEKSQTNGENSQKNGENPQKNYENPRHTRDSFDSPSSHRWSSDMAACDKNESSLKISSPPVRSQTGHLMFWAKLSDLGFYWDGAVSCDDGGHLAGFVKKRPEQKEAVCPNCDENGGRTNGNEGRNNGNGGRNGENEVGNDENEVKNDENEVKNDANDIKNDENNKNENCFHENTVKSSNGNSNTLSAKRSVPNADVHIISQTEFLNRGAVNGHLMSFSSPLSAEPVLKCLQCAKTLQPKNSLNPGIPFIPESLYESTSHSSEGLYEAIQIDVMAQQVLNSADDHFWVIRPLSLELQFGFQKTQSDVLSQPHQLPFRIQIRVMNNTYELAKNSENNNPRKNYTTCPRPPPQPVCRLRTVNSTAKRNGSPQKVEKSKDYTNYSSPNLSSPNYVPNDNFFPLPLLAPVSLSTPPPSNQPGNEGLPAQLDGELLIHLTDEIIASGIRLWAALEKQKKLFAITKAYSSTIANKTMSGYFSSQKISEKSATKIEKKNSEIQKYKKTSVNTLQCEVKVNQPSLLQLLSNILQGKQQNHAQLPDSMQNRVFVLYAHRIKVCVVGLSAPSQFFCAPCRRAEAPRAFLGAETFDAWEQVNRLMDDISEQTTYSMDGKIQPLHTQAQEKNEKSRKITQNSQKIDQKSQKTITKNEKSQQTKIPQSQINTHKIINQSALLTPPLIEHSPKTTTIPDHSIPHVKIHTNRKTTAFPVIYSAEVQELGLEISVLNKINLRLGMKKKASHDHSSTFPYIPAPTQQCVHLIQSLFSLLEAKND